MNFSASPVRRVILCADDFAVNASASRGIAELAVAGRISATSAMVLSPRWAQDVALLEPVRNRIDVGLHLDWTSEFSLSQGHGLSLGRAMLKAALGGFDRRVARTVIDHQLDLFEAHWQAPPDYVDGHQHVQQFNGIRQALVQALTDRYAGHSGRKPYLRLSRAPVGQADMKARVIAVMGVDALERIASPAGLAGSSALLGIYDFTGDQASYGQAMTQWLAQAPTGSIIMCHPAQAAESGDGIGPARVWEFAYLNGDDFPVALHAAGVEVVRGRDALLAR
ncbi:ChbG/HpnK family deacetylase [Rhodoferax sp. PAMC 29310]|uniref:ChbG/HpnK family deacetylase n=1 Tax=Rhodoferax sp. PAMC 29310 TaxID=2822760 RepID=UPI001F0AB596|nr:ChbG/HpnK family deacetylase [Rhodoferax sp. PAMC 29310]